MNIQEVRRQLEEVKQLACKGDFIIKSLKFYLDQSFKDHFIISERKGQCFDVALYGLNVCFRIEITWRSESISAKIVAILLTYDIPKKESEPALVVYTFDKLGNVNSRYTEDNFAHPFITEILSVINQNGATLRP